MTAVVPTPAIGDPIPPLRVDAVGADHIRLLALLLDDPNPIHFDLAAVRAAGLGDREVNQGAGTHAYVVDLLLAWSGSRGAVRRIDCRFAGNVVAGDAVDVGGTVTAVRTGGGTCLVDCDVWADRGDGTRVLDGTATVALPTEP